MRPSNQERQKKGCGAHAIDTTAPAYRGGGGGGGDRRGGGEEGAGAATAATAAAAGDGDALDAHGSEDGAGVCHSLLN